MEQEIEKFLENNEALKMLKETPKEELEIIRMYIKLNLLSVGANKDGQEKISYVKTCLNEYYNYLDYILSYRNRVDFGTVSTTESMDFAIKRGVCEFCKCKTCVKKNIAILVTEIRKYNKENKTQISGEDVIDSILERKEPEYTEMPNSDFFADIDIVDLMYVQAILEANIIQMVNYDAENNSAEFEYLDLTKKGDNGYYINILIDYYREKKNIQKFTISLKDMSQILEEKDPVIKIYKIAAYYKYLIEEKKINIIAKLREILSPERTEKGIRIRVRYFVYKYFKKVEELPYTQKTKDKLYKILNYILNFRYESTTPFVPINILIYSSDKEGVEKIGRILGEFMWFFGYLSDDMRYYSSYMNDTILDKFQIKKLYQDNDKPKNGILILNNFENLLYTDYMQQNLILNILTDEMEQNNKNVCTIIYGERESLDQILKNHYKLSQKLINLELEIDNLDTAKINELVIRKLKNSVYVSDEVKDKIQKYVKATYIQSNLKNTEYVNQLCDQIILNMNSQFKERTKQMLSSSAIPEIYNTRDLPNIMKDINELVGLSDIKNQINDLVALLKFNQKTNIDVANFNMHMVFSGNPGTGKTTVARLIKDIFYNLGYIAQNKLTEVTAKDLVGEYLGQTSGKTYNVVKSAVGGVLFIDEAYAITDGEDAGNKYGNECVATLLKLMEDYKNKLIIIFAGYDNKMENFLKSNPGLISRIGYKIKFPDYTLDELIQIYLKLLEKNNLKIDDDAIEKLKEIITEASKQEDFGNARYINNIFQKILIEHSKNMAQYDNEEKLYLITEEDISREKLLTENNRRKIGF